MFYQNTTVTMSPVPVPTLSLSPMWNKAYASATKASPQKYILKSPFCCSARLQPGESDRGTGHVKLNSNPRVLEVAWTLHVKKPPEITTNSSVWSLYRQQFFLKLQFAAEYGTFLHHCFKTSKLKTRRVPCAERKQGLSCLYLNPQGTSKANCNM